MIRRLGLALAACLVFAVPASAAPFVYVSDLGTGLVDEFDAATGFARAAAFIRSGDQPARHRRHPRRHERVRGELA